MLVLVWKQTVSLNVYTNYGFQATCKSQIEFINKPYWYGLVNVSG